MDAAEDVLAAEIRAVLPRALRSTSFVKDRVLDPDESGWNEPEARDDGAALPDYASLPLFSTGKPTFGTPSGLRLLLGWIVLLVWPVVVKTGLVAAREPPPRVDRPTRDAYQTLAEMLAKWALWRTPPPPPPSAPEGLVETDAPHAVVVDALAKDIAALASPTWRLAVSRAARERILAHLMETAGAVGLAALCGVRRTRKSIPCLPPPLPRLVAAFTACHACARLAASDGGTDKLLPEGTVYNREKDLAAGLRRPCTHAHNNGQLLTVGARAHAKHGIRCASSYFGQPRGGDLQRNADALRVLEQLLDDAVWMNGHLLPGDVGVLEIRGPHGYGARWSRDGRLFRGFLEPHRDDGWTTKWRH